MAEMILNMFGALLAQKRISERRPISLKEVSDATGIPYKTLYAWQNNTVTRYDAHIMDALCKYFNCGPGDLFRYIDGEPSTTKVFLEVMGKDALITGNPAPADAPKNPIEYSAPSEDSGNKAKE